MATNTILQYFQHERQRQPEVWVCGKEKCDKKYLNYTNFPQVQELMFIDHLKDAHTCGYCLDESVFETEEQRRTHRQHCFEYNILENSKRLVSNEKNLTQQYRRNLLTDFFNQNLVYYFNNAQFLLFVNKDGKNYNFLDLITGKNIDVKKTLGNKLVRLTPENYRENYRQYLQNL